MDTNPVPPSPSSPLDHACLYVAVGVILSFFAYTHMCCLGPDCIDCPKLINNTLSNTHIHHWAIHAGLLVVHMVGCHVYDISHWFSSLIVGVHLGGMLHGIYTYDDWWDFTVHISIPDLRENVPQAFIDDYLKPLDDFLPKSK
jgi:hypothetical protein